MKFSVKCTEVQILPNSIFHGWLFQCVWKSMCIIMLNVEEGCFYINEEMKVRLNLGSYAKLALYSEAHYENLHFLK